MTCRVTGLEAGAALGARTQASAAAAQSARARALTHRAIGARHSNGHPWKGDGRRAGAQPSIPSRNYYCRQRTETMRVPDDPVLFWAAASQPSPEILLERLNVHPGVEPTPAVVAPPEIARSPGRHDTCLKSTAPLAIVTESVRSTSVPSFVAPTPPAASFAAVTAPSASLAVVIALSTTPWAVVALVALMALVALVAASAFVADGTVPRLDSSTSAPFTELSATFAPVTAPF